MKSGAILSIFFPQNDYDESLRDFAKYVKYFAKFGHIIRIADDILRKLVKYLIRAMIWPKFCEILQNPLHLLGNFVILLVLKNKFFTKFCNILQIWLHKISQNLPEIFS